MSSSDKKNRILLVEDEPNIAKLFNYILTKAGYSVSYAENGKIGFKKVAEENPDLIISDIMMPEVDGFEFRKMLLTDDKLGKIPFVFLTAKGSEDDILEGYNLSIEDYIIKTASPKVVLAKIDSIFKSIKRERDKANEAVQHAAETLKAAVVPENTPNYYGYNIFQHHIPFEEIPGGDFVDYFLIDEDNLVVVLGDVMGKKWGAWYFAVAYAGYVRSAIRLVCNSLDNISAKRIMTKINDAIYNDERISEVFITLSILIINKKENTIKYCGAGDLPLFLVNDTSKLIKSNGVLLGFSINADYEDVEFEIKSGDSLFLLTDGVLEMRNNENEQLGYEKLSKILIEGIKKNNSLTEIIKELSNFSNNKFDDDISIIQINKL